MITVEVKLRFAKETKNTVQYQAVDEGALVTTLYVNKAAFPDGKYPEYIQNVSAPTLPPHEAM